MRKIFRLAISSLFVTSVCSAQQWNGSTTSTGDVYRDGNVGIGTSTPGAKLHVADGNVAASQFNMGSFVQLWGDNALMWKAGSPQNGLRFGSAANLLAGSWSEKMRITDNGYVGIGTSNPQAHLDVAGYTRTHLLDINNGHYDGGRLMFRSEGYREWNVRNFMGSLGFFPGEGNPTLLWLQNDGRVGIGTQNPGSFRLTVEGKIGAREIQVTANNPWPDYVFALNYKLRSLLSLEKYINQFKHLPGIPSAEEVKKEGGIQLGEMNVKLLEKIEELSLYVIELNKKLEQQQIEIQALKKLKTVGK